MPETINNERKHADDVIDLMRAASEAIAQALHDGSKIGHGNGDWLKHDYDHHLEHAAAHVADLTGSGELSEENRRAALSHAICRLVMAWARQNA